MTPKASTDLREFNTAIRQLSGGVAKLAVSLSNQIALDVSREWFNALPPPISAVTAKRAEIKAYMNQVLAVRVKIATSGRNRGKFIKTGKKTSQLQRRHLILQARRRRAGQRGLHGRRMAAAAAAFARRAQVSVGYLKVILLPVIRALNPLVKYKMPFSETGGASKLAIWPGSKGHGIAKPAIGKNPLAILDLAWSMRGPREGYARGLVMAGWRRAAEYKLQKLRNRIERELKPELDRVSVRRTVTV